MEQKKAGFFNVFNGGRTREKVSLLQIQQALDMPLVEVWLGLLHSPMPYQWDKQGEFYQEAKDFWINDCRDRTK